MRRLSITQEGEGVWEMMSGPLISGSSQTTVPFQFPFTILDGRVTFFYFQTPSPSISTLGAFQFRPSVLFNLNLVTFQFPNPVAFPFPPLLLDGRGA
jgi:hypothetical protein